MITALPPRAYGGDEALGADLSLLSWYAVDSIHIGCSFGRVHFPFKVRNTYRWFISGVGHI